MFNGTEYLQISGKLITIFMRCATTNGVRMTAGRRCDARQRFRGASVKPAQPLKSLCTPDNSEFDQNIVRLPSSRPLEVSQFTGRMPSEGHGMLLETRA